MKALEQGRLDEKFSRPARDGVYCQRAAVAQSPREALPAPLALSPAVLAGEARHRVGGAGDLRADVLRADRPTWRAVDGDAWDRDTGERDRGASTPARSEDGVRLYRRVAGAGSRATLGAHQPAAQLSGWHVLGVVVLKLLRAG